MMSGIDIVHVPFRGTPAAQSALMAGDVQAMFDAIGSSVGHIQSGALRAIGDDAPAGAAGRSANRRCGPRLYGDRMARFRRPQGHAEGDRRAAQSRVRLSVQDHRLTACEAAALRSVFTPRAVTPRSRSPEHPNFQRAALRKRALHDPAQSLS
jgi:hypothetical protein